MILNVTLGLFALALGLTAWVSLKRASRIQNWKSRWVDYLMVAIYVLLAALTIGAPVWFAHQQAGLLWPMILLAMAAVCLLVAWLRYVGYRQRVKKARRRTSGWG